LDEALIDLVKQAGLGFGTSPACVEGMRSVEISGTYTVAEALDKLLDHTGLYYRYEDDQMIKITGILRGEERPCDGP
jgi:hypothetical protein